MTRAQQDATGGAIPHIAILSYSRDRLVFELDAAMHALNQIPDDETGSPECVTLIERVQALEAALDIQGAVAEPVPALAVLTHADGKVEELPSAQAPFSDPRAYII